MRNVILIFIFTFAVSICFAAEKRAMTVEDMWAMKRIGTVALSPDGQYLAYDLKSYDMENNSSGTDIWMVDTKGGKPQQLTTSDGADLMPRWKPDGSAIAFLSTRDGSAQIYLLSMSGGEARKVTNLPVDVDDFIWSSDGEHVAFTATVYPEVTDLKSSAEKDKSRDESKVKARIIDLLMYRSWDRWTEGKRSHIFVCDANGQNVKDLTPGDFDSPPLDLGSTRDYCFSPDGTELAFVSNHDPVVATSTNNDIFLVSVSGGEPGCITSDNKAVDNHPVYSPDGKYIAYKAMERPGYEADQYDIVLFDRASQKKENLTDSFDLDPGEVVWSTDSKKLYFNAYDKGRNALFSLEVKKKEIKKLVKDHYNRSLMLSPDGKHLYFKRQAVNLPEEIFSFDLKKKQVNQVTFVNKDLLSNLEMNTAEDFWFSSFDGQKVHGFLLKPPFFDPAKKYPLIYLIHGGPQGMWSDDYHYRWNASMFAAPGYVVAMVNFRGSKGYGQKFCDAIKEDWGGGPYQDLMLGLDYVLDNYPFVNKDKLAAAGASYGGFMINWIATHNDRFKALVCHDGVFDQRSMYGATEELWFPEWEMGGTPYEKADMYEKWSPSYYVKNFEKFKTPILVVHGQNDYRVPVTQAFQTFTALQRYGVPSQLLYFPDETHFVTKPQNARLWWTEVFSWIEKWIDK